MFWKAISKVFDFFASVELAVALILLLAFGFGAGTIYESKYSAAVASQVIYRAFWMQILLWMFILNLTAAAISRWPWKRSHIGFLITHLGIIILLLGSWVTQRLGIDGSIVLMPSEKAHYVQVDENMLYVFRSDLNKTYQLVLNESLKFDLREDLSHPVDFFWKEGQENKSVRVLQYYPKATRRVQMDPAKSPNDGGVPAVKFQLNGSRANFDDWMLLQDLGSTRKLGPAKILFRKEKPNAIEMMEEPTLVFYLDKKNPDQVFLAVAGKKEKLRFLGKAELGKSVPLQWMDFSLTVEAFLPSAIPSATYFSAPELKGDRATQAIQLEIGKNSLWLDQGGSGQLADGSSLYYVQFGKRQIDLGFELGLANFKIGYYEGTTKAKTYESRVKIKEEEHLISMNEPLQKNGFTFYQASFEQDETGSPTASILSVNYDPGKTTKYLGSLMIIFGILSMFYFKPVYSGTNKRLVGKIK